MTVGGVRSDFSFSDIGRKLNGIYGEQKRGTWVHHTSGSSSARGAIAMDRRRHGGTQRTVERSRRRAYMLQSTSFLANRSAKERRDTGSRSSFSCKFRFFSCAITAPILSREEKGTLSH